MDTRLRTMAVIAIALTLGGCVTSRGRPDYPYDPRSVKSITAERQFATLLCPNGLAKSVTPVGFERIVNGSNETAGAPANAPSNRLCDGVLDADVRDAMIYQALGVIDLKYNQFRNEMLTTRNGINSGATALTLLATTASALTESAGVKQNYNALMQLITGGVEIYDKEFLHSHTLIALIAQMDANRAKQRNQIIGRMKSDTAPYSGQQAHNDLLEYYQAGTILGALLGVQQDARTTEKENNDSTEQILEARGSNQSAIM